MGKPMIDDVTVHSLVILFGKVILATLIVTMLLVGIALLAFAVSAIVVGIVMGIVRVYRDRKRTFGIYNKS